MHSICYCRQKFLDTEHATHVRDGIPLCGQDCVDLHEKEGGDNAYRCIPTRMESPQCKIG
jgi:hypothetical protein